MPLQKDSIRSAFYADGSAIVGFANHRWIDDIVGFQGGFHMAHSFGKFQAHYGLNGTIGKYRASDYIFPFLIDLGNDNLNEPFLDSINGNKFFGSMGFSGGINYVESFLQGGEWRVIGLEFNLQREWDNDYWYFRNKIPINYANLIEYERNYSTLSVTSEFLLKDKEINYGYKVAFGLSLKNPPYYFSNNNSKKISRGHFSQTLQVTVRKFTGYAQFNIGYYASSGLLGINYRLR